MLGQAGERLDVGVGNIVRLVRGEAPALGLQKRRGSNGKRPELPRGPEQGRHCSISVFEGGEGIKSDE